MEVSPCARESDGSSGGMRESRLGIDALHTPWMGSKTGLWNQSSECSRGFFLFPRALPTFPAPFWVGKVK